MRVRDDLRISSANDVTLHVEDFGGDGPPLLICHATGFCGGAYAPVAAALTHRFHVYALDFRGHGRSDPAPGNDCSWHRMAEDVHAVATTLDPSGVAVFGHSMGAAAALIAETRWPGTVRAAYVFEPALLADTDERPDPTAFVARTRRRMSRFSSRGLAGERLRQTPTFAGWADESLRAFLDHGFRETEDGSVELRCAPETEAACYASGAERTGVIDVAVPVTVAVGTEPDQIRAARSARILADTLPTARLVVHRGTTHFGPFERPGEIATAAVEALAF
ncbi:alpha/beta hydrolase [Sporichthya brevicatena]|uniref:Alpha/beta hydrolase n=1 Tax=Sporichthya brevicatena TaxID=171442 RepID=A0ABN1GBF5_9ACTN